MSRLYHLISGYSLLLIALAQTALGINILYPWIQPRTLSFWIAYFFLSSFWIIAFLVAEYYFIARISKTDEGYSKISLYSTIENSTKPLKTFTWEHIESEVANGALLVVANGRYVYDVSSWITSHPGGQIILRSAIGTDITSDFFHEAGFDAEEFIPTAPIPKRIKEKPVQPAAGLSRADAISIKRNKTLITPVTAFNFSSEDWSAIQRSRRTHVHTTLAIQKLTSMVIGEICAKGDVHSSRTSSISQIGLPFEKDEYRRYAITCKTVESPPQSSKVFIRIRFCVM